MTLDDFQVEHCDDPPRRLWRALEPIVTPSGEFRVELAAGGTEPDPDEAMMSHLESLLAFVREHHRNIFRRLHEGYLLSAEDPEWMESVGVPTGLSPDELAPYVGPVTLTVRRWSGDPSGYASLVSTSPQWDPEHGLDFLFRGGRLEQVEY